MSKKFELTNEELRERLAKAEAEVAAVREALAVQP